MEITKATTMGEMLNYQPGIAYILMQAGMHCVGCPSSIGESLEEACMVHGLDCDQQKTRHGRVFCFLHLVPGLFHSPNSFLTQL